MDVFFKGYHTATIKGDSICKVMKLLSESKDYLTFAEINKALNITCAGANIESLRKRHNIRIDIDHSNKSRYRYKLRDGYKINV